MFRASVIIIIIFSSILVVFSCKKQKNTIINPSDAFKLSDFPLKINNQWRYQVTDFNLHTTDTLLLKIISESVLSDSSEKYYCQIYEKNNLIDSGIFKVMNNTLTYNGLNANYSYFGNFIISFPIAPKSYWIGFYPQDTVRLITVDSTVNINSIVYRNVFYIKRSFYLLGGYSLVQSVQICKNIGVINQILYLFDDAPVQNQSFQLIDCIIN